LNRRAVALAAAGALIAAVGALCGIGGGLFAVPLLHYVFHLELRRSVATALALVFATGLAATVTELLHEGNALRWGVAVPLIVGALGGAQLGYWVSRRLPELGLKTLFLVALGAAGLRIWLMPAGILAPLPGAGELDLARLLVVVVVGVFAGMVAPLLGIGGGLVAVPGLLFFVPDLGSLGARAASMAMTVPNAARSLVLYGREGVVDRAAALAFSAGALVGGAVGVQLVHVDGMARVGQLLLGGILLATAARFGVDVARRLGTGPLAHLRRRP
jgi:uncharacterized membrane protein YfcA